MAPDVIVLLERVGQEKLAYADAPAKNARGFVLPISSAAELVALTEHFAEPEIAIILRCCEGQTSSWSPTMLASGQLMSPPTLRAKSSTR